MADRLICCTALAREGDAGAAADNAVGDFSHCDYCAQ
jgi:hypothetical protein